MKKKYPIQNIKNQSCEFNSWCENLSDRNTLKSRKLNKQKQASNVLYLLKSNMKSNGAHLIENDKCDRRTWKRKFKCENNFILLYQKVSRRKKNWENLVVVQIKKSKKLWQFYYFFCLI